MKLRKEHNDMSFICTDKGCYSLSDEIGSEKWEEEMKQIGILEEDLEKIKNFILLMTEKE